jgi:hypothetical protein
MVAGAGHLRDALNKLRRQWENVTDQGEDQKATQFDKDHIAPLEHQTSATVRGMLKIGEVISKVRQECQ